MLRQFRAGSRPSHPGRPSALKTLARTGFLSALPIATSQWHLKYAWLIGSPFSNTPTPCSETQTPRQGTWSTKFRPTFRFCSEKGNTPNHRSKQNNNGLSKTKKFSDTRRPWNMRAHATAPMIFQTIGSTDSLANRTCQVTGFGMRLLRDVWKGMASWGLSICDSPRSRREVKGRTYII